MEFFYEEIRVIIHGNKATWMLPNKTQDCFSFISFEIHKLTMCCSKNEISPVAESRLKIGAFSGP